MTRKFIESPFRNVNLDGSSSLLHARQNSNLSFYSNQERKIRQSLYRLTMGNMLCCSIKGYGYRIKGMQSRALKEQAEIHRCSCREEL